MVSVEWEGAQCTQQEEGMVSVEWEGAQCTQHEEGMVSCLL